MYAVNVAVILTLIFSTLDTPATPPPCNSVTVHTTGCVTPQVGHDALDLGAVRQTPSHRGSPHPAGRRPPASAAATDPAAPHPASDRFCYRKKYGDGPHCVPIPENDKKPATKAKGPVTLSDLRSFRPVPGTDHMQPVGWALVGLDTNFYATTPPELQHGTLLGERTDVRFTPVVWHWSYGDGTWATKGTAGATWAAQRIEELDPTATSHVYRARGAYTVDLEIEFAAEYRYAGGGWTPVDGTIDVPANELTVTALVAKTVLVAQDCVQNPKGPGC